MIKIEMLEEYGMRIHPENDMKTKEALIIIKGSRTKMEIAGNSYIYGYMQGIKNERKSIPILNLKQISDSEWNEMAIKQREYREYIAVAN